MSRELLRWCHMPRWIRPGSSGAVQRLAWRRAPLTPPTDRDGRLEHENVPIFQLLAGKGLRTAFFVSNNSWNRAGFHPL